MSEDKIKKSFGDRFFSDKTAFITALVSIAVLFLSLIVFLCFGSWRFSWVLNEQIIANYGDFVGGVVGTLLAFTAAILYYVALREQRKDVKNNQASLSLQTKALEQQIEEFKQQRIELEETRKVYERQTDLMELQSRIMKQQQFESSFYSMMRVYLDCKNQMNNKEIDCFQKWLDEVEKGLSPQFANKTIFDRHNEIMSSFENLYLKRKDILSPYFKTVYRILSLVDNTQSLGDKEKMQYVKIFRAQLSECETKLLYYNYHSDFSGDARNLSYKLNFMKHYDYMTSIDAKKVHKAELIEDKEMMMFMRKIESFVIESINKCCEGFSEEVPSLQMKFDYKDIISEVTSNPDITISLSLPAKSEKLSNDFCKLLSDFLCDRVFLSQYSKKKECLKFFEYGEVDNRRVYNCTLHTSFAHTIKTDEDYE